MSLERRRLKNGHLRYHVRWREAGRNRARSFDRRGDAVAFDAEVRRRLRLGQIGMLDAGKETLEAFKERWWSRYAQPNLAPKTLEQYEGLLGKLIIPRLGKRKLCELTPELIEDFVFELRAAKVGEASINKALVVLSGMMNRAVAWGKISTNPVTVVQRPRAGRSRVIRPLSPSQVEAIRARLEPRDASLVSVLAYAGLRPGEALALTWAHIRDTTILVEQAGLPRPDQDHEDRQSAKRQPALSARDGPERVARCIGQARRSEPRLPTTRRRSLAAPRLPKLGQENI